LQRRCSRVYDELAAADWVSPWRVLDGSGEVSVDVVVKDLLA
ncbi:MAG: hypothetical protein QOC74_1673, partial [Pseudonocardiales bacterium]|nr:hypothetical protein [Pseudonocardiales bacterium]